MTPEEIKEVAEALKIAIDLPVHSPNQLLSLIPVIVGAIIGAVASIATAITTDSIKNKRHEKALQSSIVSEITSLLEVIDAREYIKTIEEIVEELKTMKANTKYTLSVEVPLHYSRIYQNNANQIGLINVDLAPKIVRFHQLLDSVVQDVKVGGIFTQGATLKSYEQTLSIFKLAHKLGEEIKTTHT